jgi:hypothetical protein
VITPTIFGASFIYLLLLAHFLHSCALFTLTPFSFFFASFSKLYIFLMHSSSPSTISTHYFVLHSNYLLHLRHCVESLFCCPTITSCLLCFYFFYNCNNHVGFWKFNPTIILYCSLYFGFCLWLDFSTYHHFVSFYSWLSQNLRSFHFFSCCVWFLLFVVQNDDVTDFTILFQGVPFFITFCTCKCFKYVIFFLYFFSLLLEFPCLCLYIFFLYHYCCDHGWESLLMYFLV